MRKGAACLVVLASLVLGAGAAQAAPAVLAEWPFDEGTGPSVRDVSGRGLTGTFGAGAAPSWIAGHDGGFALSFGGSQYAAVPDVGTLEPAHVAVDAWVRRAGSPGLWRYVISKGAVGCDRSAYGLYSAWTGGMAFYVSDATEYFISPEVPADRVWDGAWHHVVGSYDGATVRLSVDGAQVGAGTPAAISIAYGVGSKGVYLGTYRSSSCELGFRGDIDDVRVWNDPPPGPSIPLPPIAPVPGTPTHIVVGGGGTTTAPAGGPTKRSSSAPKAACLRVTLTPRTIHVKRRVRVKATVRRASKPAAGVRVIVSGAGVKKNARTNRKGTATLVVKARKRGRLTVRVRGQRSGCPAATVRAR